jgi:hypothetical protein
MTIDSPNHRRRGRALRRWFAVVVVGFASLLPQCDSRAGGRDAAGNAPGAAEEPRVGGGSAAGQRAGSGSAAGAAVVASSRSDTGKSRPLVLLGADGLEWDLLLRFIAEGALPNFAQLAQDGFVGTLRTLEQTLSPLIWTTVATGRRPEEHGILGFSYRGHDGEPHLFLSLHRQCKALWNLHDEAGLSTEVIGWWCTFPVEPIRGGMVAQTSTRAQARIEDGAVIWKGTVLPGLPYQVWPEERLAVMDAHARDLGDAIEAGRDPVVARFGEPPPKERRLPSQLYGALQRSHYADLLFRAAARDVLDQAAAGGHLPDALLLYLGSVDVASHMFWRYLEPERFDDVPTAADVARFGSTIRTAYQFIDECIGELRRRAPEADFLLVSDHGFHAVALKEPFPDDRVGRADSGNHQDAPPGVLMAAGKGFRRQPLAAGATRAQLREAGGVEDLLPTLLVRAGLPYAHDGAGRPLRNLLAPELLQSRPIRSVPTHDDAAWRERRTELLRRIPEFERNFADALQALDRSNLDLLNQLGYGGAGLGAERDSAGEGGR